MAERTAFPSSRWRSQWRGGARGGGRCRLDLGVEPSITIGRSASSVQGHNRPQRPPPLAPPHHRLRRRGEGDGLRPIRTLVVLVLLLLGLAPAAAQTSQPSFPPLTGRVVDAAHILDPGAAQTIAEKLRAHEERSSDQVVVATVPSLQGYTVEDYANRLFRAWRLGEAKRNNGVLLLVAPAERRVRFEVGYGLEGALTDALSKVIIATAVAPRFQRGDFAGGIDAGVDAVLSTLAGDAEQWQRRPKVRAEESPGIDPVVALLLFLLVLWIVSRALRGGGGRGGRAHRTRRGTWIVVPVPGGGGFGGGWGGGFGGGGGGWSGGGGGFSGGGGSSGGGGASGSW